MGLAVMALKFVRPREGDASNRLTRSSFYFGIVDQFTNRSSSRHLHYDFVDDLRHLLVCIAFAAVFILARIWLRIDRFFAAQSRVRGVHGFSRSLRRFDLTLQRQL